jgi:hypothetical protein
MDLCSIGSGTKLCISLYITGFRMLVHHFAGEQHEEDFNFTYRSMLTTDGMLHYIRA